jgi:chorismate mutase
MHAHTRNTNRAQPEAYSALIRAGDASGLMALLTDVSVERAVVERVRLKAATFGQDIDPAAGSGSAAAPAPAPAQQQAPADGAGAGAGGSAERAYKVSPDALASMYDKIVMPLTKEVQVAYLLRRLDPGQPAPEQ